ncbi:MAG: hypothetical protein LBS01_09920 [Prevotellaceae bacterium]|jgi:hypothetical protein|nr:hypothetical protein [Prevotellaceae bacterium]
MDKIHIGSLIKAKMEEKGMHVEDLATEDIDEYVCVIRCNKQKIKELTNDKSVVVCHIEEITKKL